VHKNTHADEAGKRHLSGIGKRIVPGGRKYSAFLVGIPVGLGLLPYQFGSEFRLRLGYPGRGQQRFFSKSLVMVLIVALLLIIGL